MQCTFKHFKLENSILISLLIRKIIIRLCQRQRKLVNNKLVYCTVIPRGHIRARTLLALPIFGYLAHS